MSELHDLFVGAAYGVSALAIGGLVLWTALDARRQRRLIADLERGGLRRRSAAARREGDAA